MMPGKQHLTKETATRVSDPAFYAALAFLPNPDSILRKLGVQQEVYEGIMGDAHVIGELRSIRGGLLGQRWRIMPGGDDRASTQALALCEEVMTRAPSPGLTWADIIWSMGCAVFRGFAVQEVVWGYEGRYLLPRKIIDRPQTRFVFAVNNELRLRTRENQYKGVEFMPRKWLITRHMGSFDNPYGVAIFSSLFWPFKFKHSGLKWFSKRCEKYGFPWPIGKYPVGATVEQQNELADNLANLVEDAVAVIPSDSTVELLQMEQSGEPVHERLIMLCNREISKALTSQTLATEIQTVGARAASQTHREREKAVNQSDRLMIEETFNELFRWITELNITGARPPKFTFYKKAEARLEMAEFLNEARKLVPLSRRECYDRLQLTAPKEQDDMIAAVLNQNSSGEFANSQPATVHRQTPPKRIKKLSEIDQGDALSYCISMKALSGGTVDTGECIASLKKTVESEGGQWQTKQDYLSNGTAEFAGFDDWIEVFISGNHVDSAGNPRYWSLADLDSMVSNYNAADPFPAVIGHPKNHEPVYAVSCGIKRVGQKLLAKFKNVNPDFEAAVRRRAYRNRSIAIDRVENGFKVVHVGWLGAVPPAVQGLAPVRFNASS